MLAAVTPLPVIGVPVPLKHLDGMDSLLSIVQMPGGVPVATVSIGGARNAGLLAARILASGTDEEAAALRARMVAFQQALRDEAHAKGERLRSRTGPVRRRRRRPGTEVAGRRTPLGGGGGSRTPSVIPGAAAGRPRGGRSRTRWWPQATGR